MNDGKSLFPIWFIFSGNFTHDLDILFPKYIRSTNYLKSIVLPPLCDPNTESIF